MDYYAEPGSPRAPLVAAKSANPACQRRQDRRKVLHSREYSGAYRRAR
jgi:hypothetical protein